MTVGKKPNKINIRSLSKEELIEAIGEKGHPAFRAKQIWEWLWKKQVVDFKLMSNLPLPLREQLSAEFEILNAVPYNSQLSKDGTFKTTFRLFDGNVIEAVLIPDDKRNTACISSQVGCKLGCHFCATASIGLKRSLSFDEILDQLFCLEQKAIEQSGNKLSNIVFMGMGEPLLNFEALMKAIQMITSPEGMGMSPTRITVSTVGISKQIKRLADEKTNVNLALSLHAANDELRSSIIPFNDVEPIKNLIEALRYFHEVSGQRITIEYILFDKLNDDLKHAKELANFCRNFPVKINLIPYNQTDMKQFKHAQTRKVTEFAEFLKDMNMVVNIRRSRGSDISAACGQLANKG
ncbi:MAG: 23S rRNA (adenine(2503)-C(2))-methyltransferase RlmN [Bacteroidota bacterium]